VADGLALAESPVEDGCSGVEQAASHTAASTGQPVARFAIATDDTPRATRR
jgi:hypothetical protein